MRILIRLFVSIWILSACKENPNPPLLEGNWRGVFTVQEGKLAPTVFTILLDFQKDTIVEFYNGDETIRAQMFKSVKDSFRIELPVFEDYLLVSLGEEGMNGYLINESLGRKVDFKASSGSLERFSLSQKANVDVSGKWEVLFNYEGGSYPAMGIFEQNGQQLSGTFRTNTGDYRYLEGVVVGDSLKLSTFDGAHMFYFEGQTLQDSISGYFYSGNHSVETFHAKRNENFDLRDAEELTYLKDGFEKIFFEFPNIEGKMVSLTNEEFKNKPVVIQIMGTWCPNCLDETKFLVNYQKNNPKQDFEIIALAFEYAKTEEKAWNSIRRLKERVGVGYPILLAQFGSKDKGLANEKLPALNHILSFPTTIFLNRKHEVMKIHTGFNGPATGVAYEDFVDDFEKTIKELAN